MRIIYPCEIKPKQEISRYQNNIRKDNCVLGKDKSKQTQQRLLNCGDCAHHFCSIGFGWLCRLWGLWKPIENTNIILIKANPLLSYSRCESFLFKLM